MISFWLSIVSHKTEERNHHYAAKSEIGIAVGSSARSNRSVLVFIPDKGTCAWERHDVREHKIIAKGAATELEKESLGSIIGEDWSSIQFQSGAAKTGDLSVPRSHDHQPGEGSRTSEFTLVLPDPRTEQILLLLPR